MRKQDELLLYEDFKLYPEAQHIPRDPLLQHLRPPPPRLLPDEDRTIFIGTSGFRDGFRCGKSLFTALSLATNPSRLRFGVVDQLLFNKDDVGATRTDDLSCVEAFCELARNHIPWINTTGTPDCP